MKFLLRAIATGFLAWFLLPVTFTTVVVLAAGFEGTEAVRTVFLLVSIFAVWPLLMLLWYHRDSRQRAA